MSKNLRKQALERMSSNSGTSLELENSIDGDAMQADWPALSLSKHADVVEALERGRVMLHKDTFARSFNPSKTASRSVINHSNVTALILKYLRHVGLAGAAAALEAEANVHTSGGLRALEDSILQNLLIPGVSDAATILAPEGRDQDIDEAVEQPVYDFLPILEERIEMPNISIWEDEPESEDNLLLCTSDVDAKSLTVKYGTLNKIIMFLSSEQPKDLQIRSTFLATYLSYCSPETLLNKLIERYEVPDSVEDSEARQIQLRIVLIFKAWMEAHPDHFSDGLVEKLREFIANISNEKLAKNLRTAVSKMQAETAQHQVDESTCPDPIVPSNIFSPALVLEDIEPEEVARQLTLIDFAVLRPITLSELITMQWMKSDDRKFASNRYILRFNTMVKWCISQVLRISKYKERAQKIIWLVTVAHHLVQMKSFSSSFAIYLGLSHGSVGRLTHTFAALPQNARKMWKELCNVMNPACGFSSYRQAFSDVKPPRIPFLGAHLQELIQIEATYPDFVRGMVNFEKRKLQFRAVDEVLRYSNVSFNYYAIHQVQSFLRRFEIVFEDEDSMYRRSQKIEPKGITAAELVEQEQRV